MMRAHCWSTVWPWVQRWQASSPGGASYRLCSSSRSGAYAGLVLAYPTLALTARIHDIATAVVLQFCGTFGVWMLAERLHLSGIITMVVFAMAASRRAPEVMPARIRIPSWAVWEVAVFVLDVLAFILVGFQLKSIAAHARGRSAFNMQPLRHWCALP